VEGRCECSAHQSDLEWAYELIEIPQPVTDDWGLKLANVLLPVTFKESELFNYLQVEGVMGGSVYAMNYVLHAAPQWGNGAVHSLRGQTLL